MKITVITNNQPYVVDFVNAEYLPLFYLYSKELLQQECPSLVDLPRSFDKLLKNEKWIKVVASDYFLSVVIDLTAFLVWPSLGVRGYMECFSGYDPVWMIAHAANVWLDAFQKIGGITVPYLVQNKRLEMPFLTTEEMKDLFQRIGQYGAWENDLYPIIETVKQMRCIEDYDRRTSNIKKDFYRHWYHTRWRYQTVSIEQLIDEEDENGDSIGSFISDSTSGFENGVCEKVDALHFYASLSPKNQEILKLRAHGYTYQEIADRLGYKTHSAVLKRIRKITEQYLDYTDEQEGLREFLSGE